MVEHVLESPVNTLSTEDTVAAENFEDNALDDVPQEVVEMIGVYDTDCAGGCG
jgi:hypothetical protein